MKTIQFAKDVVPIGAFKSKAAAWLQRLKQSGHSIIITQNGVAAGILMSPEEYDRLQEKELFLESVAKGLADAEAGRVMTAEQLRQQLTSRREAKKSS